MQISLTRSWLRALSGLFINLAAGWFGLVFITPNITDTASFKAILVLTMDVLFGIVFLLATVKVEEALNHE